MSKHLHIFHDEKFTNTIVKQFSNTKINNQIFVVIYEDKNTVKYPLDKELLIESIIVGSDEYNHLIQSLIEYDNLFIHFLCYIKMNIIKSVPSFTKIIWMCWGQDIHKLIIDESYLEQTKKLLWNNKNYTEYFWSYTIKFRRLKFHFSSKRKILQRINYCCPVIKSDLELTNKKLKTNIKYIPFHYGYLEDFVNVEKPPLENKKEILIGNSSSYASNHLDAFTHLKKINLQNQKIIIPLNYGDKVYANHIEEEAIILFKSKAFILKQFISSDKYEALLENCSVAVFNHIRQQALGNIIISLWNGTKVFMNEKSNLYWYLLNMGLKIFPMQDDIIGKPDFLKEQDAKTTTKNREILTKEFGRTNTNQLTENIFTIIKNNK